MLKALGLVERQYQLGAVSYLASLDAQRTYLATRVSLVQARAGTVSAMLGSASRTSIRRLPISMPFISSTACSAAPLGARSTSP